MHACRIGHEQVLCVVVVEVGCENGDWSGGSGGHEIHVVEPFTECGGGERTC